MRFWLAVFLTLVSPHAWAIETLPVTLEEMTWPQVREVMSAGRTTAIIPTGGTEQNGPHLSLGKHNRIVHVAAQRIAWQVNALVAPVIAYVPEGNISPPEGHMKFPGTISVREETFESLLEDAARSLQQHGFKLICFIGDHGGNQNGQKKVAEKLTKEWAKEGVRVLHVSDYYANNGQREWAAKTVPEVKNPEAHAGFMDTSELMAVGEDSQVRMKQMRHYEEQDFDTTGVKGDPMAATRGYGNTLLELKIGAAVKQIKAAQGKP